MSENNLQEKMDLYNEQVLDEIFGISRAKEEEQQEWSKDMFEGVHDVV